MTYATIKIGNETCRVEVDADDEPLTVLTLARFKYAAKRLGSVQRLSWCVDRSDELTTWYAADVLTVDGDMAEMEWFERKLDHLHNVLNAQAAIERAKQKGEA